MNPRWGRRKTLAAAGSIAASLSGCLHREHLYSPPEPEDLELPDQEWPYEGSGWPMYGYDPGNSGFNPDSEGPKDEVSDAWIVSMDDTGYTDAAEAGQETPGSTPAVYDDLVFVGALGRESLLAVDVGSGEIVWQYEVGNKVESDPAVEDGRVFFNDGGGRFENHLGWLYAVEAYTGDRIWRIRDDCLKPKPYGALVILGSDGRLRAVTAERGVELWGFRTEENAENPVVQQGAVYYGSNRLNAVDVRTGETIWTSDEFEAEIRELAAADDQVYILTEDGVTHAIDTETREKIWQTQTEANRTHSSLSVSEDHVFAAEFEVEVLDRESGGIEWSATAGIPRWHANKPVILDGVVYSATSAYITAWDEETGERIWREGARAVTPPTVVDGRIYYQHERISLAAYE